MTKVPLTQGKFALVDAETFPEIAKFKWHFHQTGYAMRSAKVGGKKHLIRMHREIMKAPSGMSVDHINGNGLDNRKSNLRLATHKENQRNRHKNKNNSSGFKGVSKNRKGWRARITVDYVEIGIGTFKTAEEAARAYDLAATKYYGSFAQLNFKIEQTNTPPSEDYLTR